MTVWPSAHTRIDFEPEMERLALPTSTIARQELEDTWRIRLDQIHRLYHDATTTCRKLLQEDTEGRLPIPANVLVLAREAESEALIEYSRVLGIFTDLTIHGKLPEETVASVGSRSTGKMISVVDDDESIRDSTETLLRSAGYLVATFASAELFLESGAVAETECVIVDVRMPGMNGLELQRHLNASNPNVPIIFITAHDDAANRRSAIDAGAVDFLSKPFDARTLLTMVQRALAHGQVPQPDT
jgi:CheY-like chemotaxis protein